MQSSTNFNYARPKIFTELKIQVVTFWVMMQCSDVVGYQRSGDLCHLHPSSLHPEDGRGKVL